MLNYKVEGLEQFLRKCDPRILSKPLRELFTKAAVTGQNKSREGAPVDSGRLRSDINYAVDPREVPLFAQYGTAVEYAPFQEFGTGAMSDGEGSSDWHWPPAAALDTWAARHGFESGYQVAKIIGQRGGLKPKRFLRNAFDEIVRGMGHWIGEAERAIREQWDR